VIADEASPLPMTVRELGGLYLEQIAALDARVGDLDRKLRAAAVRAETTRRLQTMPGVGPVTAVAVETFALPMETFRRGRDFAAWLGLVPCQRSTGGKQRLGRTSKMGEPRHPSAAHRRRDGGDPGGQAPRSAGGLVAGAHAGEEAADAGRDRARPSRWRAASGP
jgi:transposase